MYEIELLKKDKETRKKLRKNEKNKGKYMEKKKGIGSNDQMPLNIHYS